MMRRALRHAGQDASEQGTTLIELVIAMVILGSMAIAVIGIIMNTQAQGVRNRDRIAAANLAAREIDLVREQFGATDSGPVDLANAGLVVNPNPLVGGTAGQPLVVDGTRYTVSRSSAWNITGTGASACEGGSLVAYPSLGVNVTVTWAHMGSVKPVTNNASFAPDKDTGVSTLDSFIAAKVVDQDAAPLSGIQVTATGTAVTSAFTDSTGCAVIRVTPAAAGTTYVVKVNNSSYVDISGNVNPSKSTGPLLPSKIYSGASFAVGKAGSVTLHLVRSDGGALSDAQVNGSSVSLVASQYSGASGQSTRTVTGVTTVLSGMYPTTYGGFFGAVAPAGGYSVSKLTAGGSVTLNIPFEMAHIGVVNLPAGTTKVVAVPAGTATTCPAASGFAASGTEASFDLMPGAYDLYAIGSNFACSPGPKAVAYGSGDNDDTTWGSTMLQLQSVPGGGSVWMVEKKASGLGATPSTCPAIASPPAINVDAARTAPMAIPAGDYYVWQTNGASNGTCVLFPTAINSFTVPYGVTTLKAFPTTYATLAVSGLSSSRYVVWSTSSTTCTTTTATPTPTLGVQGPTTTSNSTLSIQAPRPLTAPNTTYYAYVWNKSSGGNACTSIGTYAVGPSSGTLTKTSSDAPTAVKGP